MLTIGDITEHILYDYLKATGRTGMGSTLSVEEYLLIRNHALLEFKSGIGTMHNDGYCTSNLNETPDTFCDTKKSRQQMSCNQDFQQEQISKIEQKIINSSMANEVSINPSYEVESKKNEKIGNAVAETNGIKSPQTELDKFEENEANDSPGFLDIIKGIPD